MFDKIVMSLCLWCRLSLILRNVIRIDADLKISMLMGKNVSLVTLLKDRKFYSKFSIAKEISTANV